MENEEIFAGDAALDIQQGNARISENRRTEDGALLEVHHEPLLASNDPDNEWPEGVQESRTTDPWSRWRQPSIYWLLPFALIYTIGFGALAVPKVNLVVDLICRNYFYEKSAQDPNFSYPLVILSDDNPQCQIPEVQAKVARFQLFMNLITGTVAALISPRLGRLSDQYGRTKILALCGFGAACNELISCIVGTWPDRVSVNLLFLGSLMDGLAGSITGAQVLLHSYATDCTTPDRRSVAFGYFHGVLFFGVAAGPSGAAYIIYKMGTSLIVFYAGATLHLLFSLAVLFVVPESLSKESQLAARARDRLKTTDADEPAWLSWQTINPMNLITPLAILFPPVGRPSALFPNPKGATSALRRNILMLALIDMVVFGVAMGVVQVIVIYARLILGWGDVQMSLFAGIINGIRAINLFVLYPIINRFFRTPIESEGKIVGCDRLDVVIIRVSVFLDTIGFIGYSLSTTGPQWLLSAMGACFGGMGPPTLQSAMTKHVYPDQVGQLLGVTGLLHALARIVAPTSLNLIYSVTVGTFPQAVFVILTGCFGAVLILSFFVRSHVTLDDEPELDIGVEANEDGEGEEDQLLLR
ncbi:hypothetical protein N7540_011558 [Penicillium herquei]|nr:hypothetical protein N7540_011558 [Penicillium herquei]